MASARANVKADVRAKANANAKANVKAKHPRGPTVGTAPDARSAAREPERVLATLPPLTDVERAAFAAQFVDARCDAMGAQTRSAAVVQDALAFVHAMEPVLSKHGDALRRYGTTRFAWLLECIVALTAARALQSSQKGAGDPFHSAREAAVARAHAVRRELVHALELLIGERPLERAELDRARGGHPHSKTRSQGKPEVLAASLNDLARLADGWLRRADGESRALVAAIDLQRGDVDQAWAAAQALEVAIERASGVRRSTRDTAPVNRAEGRVLLEMRCATNAFSHANQANKLIPRLVPGPGTRHTLAAPRGKRSATVKEESATKGNVSATPAGESATPAGESATPSQESATGEKESATRMGKSATVGKESATVRGESATGKAVSPTWRSEPATYKGESATTGRKSATIKGESATGAKKSATHKPYPRRYPTRSRP